MHFYPAVDDKEHWEETYYDEYVEIDQDYLFAILGSQGPYEFPQKPLEIYARILLSNGTWLDITSDIRSAAGITITREINIGGEGFRAVPTNLDLWLNNRDAKYNSRNPNSELYGLIGRNTQIQTGVRADPRATCEIPAWPQQWDKTGNDVWVPLKAYGLTYRLNQSNTPALRSPLTRSNVRGGITYTVIVQGGVGFLSPEDFTFPVAYWSLEDDSEAITGASEIDGVDPISLVGSIALGSTTPIPGSDDLAKFEDSTAKIIGVIPVGAYPSDWSDSDDGTMMRVAFSYSELEASGADLLRIEVEDDSGSTWRHDIDLNGAPSNDTYDHVVSRYATSVPGSVTTLLTQSVGKNTVRDWEIYSFSTTTTNGGVDCFWSASFTSMNSGDGGTVSGLTCGKFKKITINARSTCEDLVVGHVIVYPSSALLNTAIIQAAGGYTGDTVFERLARLFAEENIEFSYLGDPAVSPTMGVQRIAKLIDLIHDCQDVDQGMLYEPRRFLGYEYLAHDHLRNQTEKLTLNYTSKHLAGDPPFPTEDNPLLKNDVKVKRYGGSSARSILDDDSALAIGTIGRYEEEIQVNTEDDTTLKTIADFNLSIGTLDVERYPNLEAWLQRTVFSTDQSLTDAATTLDIGQFLKIQDLPAWVRPDEIEQLVRGSEEFLQQFKRQIKWSCIPYDVYQVGIFDSLGSRYDSAYSTLASSFAAGSDTSMSVAIATNRQLWTTDSTHFPFDILVDGVRLRVTNIAGASSPQTFTVSSTIVNNVTAKTIAAGASVRMWKPARWGKG